MTDKPSDEHRGHVYVPIEQLVDPTDNPADGPQSLDRLLARAVALERFMRDDEPTFSLLRVPRRP